MLFFRWGEFAFVLLFLVRSGIAQGPPITGDKPIMAGARSTTLRTLTEVRTTERGNFLRLPLEIDYLPVTDVWFGVEVPFVRRFGDEFATPSKLGDVQLSGKYQFMRRDQTGRTFRLVAKTAQRLPTGPDLNAEGVSMGRYMGYYGTIAGYESLKLGVAQELGFRHDPGGDMDELRYQLGFGLPLLQPTYPVKQVNLFFEYRSTWYPAADEYLLLYAQGLQYARGRFTVEAAVQFPLIETRISGPRQRNYSVFLGTRYAF